MKHVSAFLTLLICGVFMSGFAQVLDRSIRPQGQPVPRVELPAIQKTTLGNGLKVWLVEAHELPLVAFNLVLQSGTDTDPIDEPGLASMTADVLDEGTKTRSALEIAEQLDFIGADLRVNAFTDGSSVTLNTLTKHLDKALALYADVITHPTFPEREFDRLKQQRLTSLLQQKDRASTIASLAFNKIIFGTNHPYGTNSSGTESSIGKMTRQDVARFYETYYRPNNATLIVVGDATLQELSRRLETLFRAWRPKEVPPVKFPPPPSIEQRSIYLIDKPGAPQSEIRIGYPAVARNTPDYFSINLMNRALGAQFSSRLNMNLRERRGFTYGARSGFSFNRHPGAFVASAGVTTAKTDSAVQEFFYEIDRMQKEGITPEELDFVKKGTTGNFALSFETPSQIAGALQNIVLYTLPENYYQTYLKNFDAVTLDDVRAVAQKYLDSSHMDLVIVGDLKVIQDDVAKMNLGKTILCDVNGDRVSQ